MHGINRCTLIMKKIVVYQIILKYKPCVFILIFNKLNKNVGCSGFLLGVMMDILLINLALLYMLVSSIHLEAWLMLHKYSSTKPVTRKVKLVIPNEIESSCYS